MEANPNMISVTNTELIMKEQVLDKVKELSALLMDSEEVQQFKQAEHKIQSNERVQTLIATIKKRQKEIVAFEQMNHQAMIEKVQKELDELNEELDSIPIVSTFKQAQLDINYLLQLVTNVIADTVSERISVETGASKE